MQNILYSSVVYKDLILVLDIWSARLQIVIVNAFHCLVYPLVGICMTDMTSPLHHGYTHGLACTYMHGTYDITISVLARFNLLWTMAAAGAARWRTSMVAATSIGAAGWRTRGATGLQLRLRARDGHIDARYGRGRRPESIRATSESNKTNKKQLGCCMQID